MRYSVISLALALCACGETKRVAEFIPTPPERLVCQQTGTRPAIPPEYTIDWTKVSTVAQAHAEHDKYVAVIRSREGVVAGYVLDIEGKLFTCFNNAQWRRDFEADLAKTHGQVR
jgi:hypothetical protein